MKHELNLPWSVKVVNGQETGTIVDCNSIPVSHATGYTSLKQRISESEVYYNFTDTARIIRARLIVEQVNKLLEPVDG